MNSQADQSAAKSAMRVLIVDNEKELARAMAESLERIEYECTVATSGPEGKSLIDDRTFDLVVTDLSMNEVDGMEILSHARETLPDCEVIMVTGHATVPRAVEAMQLGAYNFLEKPITPKRLQAIAVKASEAVRLRLQNQMLSARLDERFGFENLIYYSESMQRVIERLKRIAPTDAGVLITGETGTGKDVVAQAIHQNSPRKKKPYVAINTAAVSEHLVESELFGHVRGSFTDAVQDRVGKFEYASGGTLFLDEVGDMPMSTQIKLLRVLEERKIIRVGDNTPIDVNVRVIAATNKDLQTEIEAGNFRQDLYYRLKIVSVHLDPLSQRRDDIIPLADEFRRQANKKMDKSTRGFTPELTKWLFAYSWEGNVRQLKNVVESLVVMDLDGTLDMDDLSPDLLGQDDWAPTVRRIEHKPDGDEPVDEKVQPPATLDAGMSELVGKPLKEIERWAIEQTLKLTNGNREDTANTLGISERNLYRKIKEYGLNQ